MALISKSSIQEVNNRINAISLVEEYVQLEKKGGRWWGRCPFHAGGQEKTPSFKVDPDMKMYHCFGCGKGGSVIGFVMEMDKITYPEAIKLIAKKLGVELTYEEGGSPPEEEEAGAAFKEQLFELYRRTNVTFQHFLLEKDEGQDALRYLGGRGINREMIDRFKLGFAPADRDFLFKFLQSKGYSDGFLEKSGLFSSRYKNLPLFSGRLIFPISDRQGRITAFGGRALPGTLQNDGNEPPKYINSPETEIYRKGHNLYALDLALPEIRKTKTVFLAEGYMDVIALHQGGVTNAVAPLGTAFTDDQAALLRRWAEKIVLILDTDEAGEKAAFKAIITSRRNGLSCSLARMEQALKNELGGQGKTEDFAKFKDPADILQKFGGQILNKILNYTINDTEYLIGRSKSLIGADGSGKDRAAEFLFPYLDALDSDVERDDCMAFIADSIRVDRKAVQGDYSRWKTGIHSRRNAQEIVQTNKPVLIDDELRLLAAVALNMVLYREFRTAVEIKEIDNPDAKELFIAMEECFIHEESDTDSLLARIRNESLRNFIAGRGASDEFKGNNAKQFVEDGINKVVKKRLNNRLTEIVAEISNNERNADSLNTGGLTVEELLAEKMEIDSKLRKLEGR